MRAAGYRSPGDHSSPTSRASSSHVELEAGGGRPGATPLRMRFDPHGKLGYSVPIAAAQP